MCRRGGGCLNTATASKPQRHACGGHRDSLRAGSPSVMQSTMMGASAQQLRQQNFKVKPGKRVKRERSGAEQGYETSNKNHV